jgi:hypothetical protein
MTVQWIVPKEDLDYAAEEVKGEGVSEKADIYYSVKGRFLTNNRLM